MHCRQSVLVDNSGVNHIDFLQLLQNSFSLRNFLRKRALYPGQPYRLRKASWQSVVRILIHEFSCPKLNPITLGRRGLNSVFTQEVGKLGFAYAATAKFIGVLSEFFSWKKELGGGFFVVHSEF